MNIFFTCLLIGISLSMDAFSLALIYGTCGLSLQRQVVLAMTVGLFHFVMPLLGLWLGNFVVKYFVFDTNLLVGIIFSIIGLEMMFSFRESAEFKLLTGFLGNFLFGFTVSIDSFTTGIGLSLITNHYFFASSLFMLLSFLFTFMGLRLGNYLNQNFGKYACFCGGIVMIILAFYYIF